MITIIKDEFRRIRQISGRHFILSILAAFLMTGIAVLRVPLDKNVLSPVNWFFICFIPLIALSYFYFSMQKNVRSVFWFTKCVYYIGMPFALMLLYGIFFDPNKATIYCEDFFVRFLPIWIILWWFGIGIMVVLIRVIEHATVSGYAKDSSGVRMIYDLAVMFTPQKTISSQKREDRHKWVVVSICMLMVALAVFILTVTLFLHNVYSNMEFEAILFTITFAAGGLAMEDLIAGSTLFLLFTLVTVYFCYNLIKCFRYDVLIVADSNKDGKYTLVLNGKKRAVHIVMSAVLLLISTLLFSRQTNFGHYISIKSNKSNIYSEYYVKPDESLISFPENKRNLIYIFLESMENTYASKDVGGSQEKNYISDLSELVLEKDCVNFSNTEQLGGASVYVPSITYTMGSTVAQTSGISMNTTPFSENVWAKEFPDVIRLEDILHDNGYNQLYIEGSKGEFSLYDKYVGRYEDSKVLDRIALVEQGYADENEDYIWKWGIEDQKLIEITKELITEMSQKDKPFFVTMYTMDTHTFESGHRCENCDNSINNDYLASVECSSRLVSEFVKWIRQQPFFENTTVILVGDHLGNKKTAMIDVDDEYVRTTYNCFINPAKEPVKTQNRHFSSLDMFPTTLSAIGVEIKGDRLGLGTDLFSQSQTLCEQLGDEEYKEQLERNNDYS